MKQILIQFRALLVVIPALIFTSCQSDNLDDNGPNGNNKEVVFSINVPKSSAPSSYALGDTEENEIATIEMLLFQGGNVVHNPVFANVIKTESMTTKSFSVKLPEGTYDIMIFANSRKAFKSATITAGDAQEATLAKLTVDLPTTGWVADKNDANKDYLIPMWGMKNNLSIGQGTTITGIYMHRMLSRIDLSVTGDDSATGAFKLLDINVHNPQTKGRIAPIMTNWDPSGVVNGNVTGKATAPSLAVGATKGSAINYKSTIATDKKSNKREIYIFEAPKASGHADLLAPYITIQAEFEGIAGWYRIDLANYSNMNYLNVLRNSLYKIEIEKVTGTGFPSEEDAKKNRADNIIVNITQWNEYDLSGTAFDGRYELLVSPTTIETNRLPLVTVATVATDHPDVPIIGVWNDIAGTIALTDWMSATITAAGTDASGRKLYDLKITILENATTLARTGYVQVKVGRLTNMVKVVQQEPKVRTIPTGGVVAEPNILAVNSKGELNLDGDGHIVYFKWGSLIAQSSDASVTTFPEAVAWVPSDTYTTIHKDFASIAYQSTGNYPTTENSTTAIGDPCRLAKRNGVAGKYKTPTAVTQYMGTVAGDYGGLTTSGGRPGYMYKGHTNGMDMQFYPFTGARINSSGLVDLDRGFYSSATTSPFSGDGKNRHVLHISDSFVDTQSGASFTVHALPIRCVEDVTATKITGGGVRGQTDILSVDVNGELNLDGRGEIVLFKWGSLVALSGNNLVTTYPEVIAWVPPTYNGMGSGFMTIPFADKNRFPTTNNLQTGVGDPCKEAVKGGATGGYKMPTGNPYMGTIATDYGAWVTEGGAGGRWYKHGQPEAFFYPAVGYRIDTSTGVPMINIRAHYWSNANGPTPHSELSLYFNNEYQITVAHENDVRTLAFAVRCVPQ